MAITKRLTDLMGGTITVESRLGSGTTFKVMLPMESLPDAEEVRVDFSGIRVLLVEDDPILRDCAVHMLQSMGIQVEFSGFAEEEPGNPGYCPKMEKYDLVILSSDLEGAEFLEKAKVVIKSLQGRAPIVLSVYNTSGIKEKAAALGIVGFLDKPFYRSTISSCIDRYLFEDEPAPLGAKSYDFSGIPVLLVEDNELNREIALEILGGFGLKLDTAVNGIDAVHRFEESKPGHYALVLMDIQMPLMNGYEAARAIRSLLRHDSRTVPILAMTADAFVEDIENAKAAGMNGHLSKPLDFDLLAREISKYLSS